MANRFRFRRSDRPWICQLATPLVAMLAFTLSSEAHSQIAPGGIYGGYGWGGWGGETVVGSGFRGMGAFARGLGAGDLRSAQADAVRTQSFIELNEYLYQSARLHRLRAAAARQESEERVEEAREELRDRRTNDPNTRDIESGDAINTILYEIDNPAIPDSVVRDAAEGMTIPGKSIQKIPFMFTHRGTAISLRRLTSDGSGWPAALRAEALAPLRDRYEDRVERIIEIPEGESVPSELLSEARAVLGEMYRTIEQANLEGPKAAEALRHLKAQAAMIAMLEEPEVKQVIDEAADVDQVTLPTLLNFMRFYNLQFGAAETPEEKALYRQDLYPKFAELHQSLREQFNGQLPGSTPSETEQFSGDPTGAFDDLDWEALGIPSGAQPAPSNRDETEGSLDPSR
ncbi:hypothetical protein [Tautonia marina]|uniref:hypothetical protein n=1 Tax=Tautonia marina TaxID=2653855 RepID=UPI001261198A|nr:hypothetical protein [Tautonia marina]